MNLMTFQLVAWLRSYNIHGVLFVLVLVLLLQITYKQILEFIRVSPTLRKSKKIKITLKCLFIYLILE